MECRLVRYKTDMSDIVVGENFMSNDFWDNLIIGDQNFDGKVDYYDQMIVDEECEKIGHVSLGGGTYRAPKKTSSVEIKNEPVIEGSSFKIFAFECFYFAVCTILGFLVSLIPWVIIMVLCGVDDTTNPAMIASFSTGVVFAIIFTIGFHFANKEEIERKRKNPKKDFLSSK